MLIGIKMGNTQTYNAKNKQKILQDQNKKIKKKHLQKLKKKPTGIKIKKHELSYSKIYI